MSEKIVSTKTLEELKKAIKNEDLKTAKWITNSIDKGHEGAGVVPYIYENGGFHFILGINKEGFAEYPGGKVEENDTCVEDTARREFNEETSYIINRERLNTFFQINGGTTGYPSYVFLVKFDQRDFDIIKQAKSTDGTFTDFIKVSNIFDCDKVTDALTNKEYEIRKFNKKYIFPQIKDEVENWKKYL
jgi:8-oxo-dGTP pyrophosphatase MutT (NUDIX family)